MSFNICEAKFPADDSEHGKSKEKLSPIVRFFLNDSTGHLRSSLLKRGLVIGRYDSSRFADQERRYLLREDITGKCVALIASVLSAPESLFDLLTLHRLLRENGAAGVTLTIPYLGYARQDHSGKKGEAGIGVMVARLLRQTKAAKLIVFDLHSERIRKALGIAATHGIFSAGARKRLSALPIDEILVTNTLPQARSAKIRCLDIVPLLNPNPA